MRRSVYILFICFVLWLSPSPGTVSSAEETTRLRIDERQGFPGDTLEVPVYLDNPGGISGGEFVLTYDPLIIEPRDIQRGNLTRVMDGYLFLSNLEFTENSVKASWVGLKEINSEGTVSVIVFFLKEEGVSALEIEQPVLTDREGEKIDLSVVHGSIAVLPASSSREGRENTPSPRGSPFLSLFPAALVPLTLLGLLCIKLRRRWRRQK